MQNAPNPWRNETVITLEVPESGSGTILVRDLVGKIILSRDAYFEKGENRITLDNEDIQVNGLLMYELRFKNQSITRRMIHLK
jgi:hypothetical protein